MDNVAYPLFVQLDDGRMLAIESLDRILYHLEAIDIENNEYSFWDSTERPVRMTVRDKGVVDVSYCASRASLRAAFLSYLDAVKLPRTLAENRPGEILQLIECELKKRPKKKGWLSRLFSA